MRSNPAFRFRGPISTASILFFSVAFAGAENHGIDVTTIDKSISPLTDFYRYANNGWLNSTTIPSDRSTVGAFNDLAESNRDILRSVVEAAAGDKRARGARGKVGLYYRVALDLDRADQLGVKPIQSILDDVSHVHSKAGLLKAIIDLQGIGIRTGFSFGVGPDAKNSAINVVNLGQGGLGLGDRDDYFNDDARTKRRRGNYVEHVSKLLALLGDTNADAEAKDVLEFETSLAKAAKSRLQMRDPQARYRKVTFEELVGISPEADWATVLPALGVGTPKTVIVSNGDYLTAYGKALVNLPLTQWKTYLRWNVISSLGGLLSKPFRDEDFRYGALESGVKEQPAPWRRALTQTESALGEAAGQLYVEKAFTPTAKQQALELVMNLEKALRGRIQELDWMGPQTKAEATKKLDNFRVKIGYPDKWKDYRRLEVKDDSLVQNAIRSRKFEYQRMVSRNGKPTDPTTWSMTPPTVNAYYNPSGNEIVFPAGILQAPFFDPAADEASNYGGIGAVIGHEMTHGFDDTGRQYDALGNLRDWWTPADAAKFKEKADRLVEQYNGYVALEDVHVNGKLTLGENIADLGGLTIAYRAYKLATAGKPDLMIGGLTGDQRFFVAWAQVWRMQIKDEAALARVRTDSHSPNPWRVNGTLTNIPAFQKAFGGQPVPNPILIW